MRINAKQIFILLAILIIIFPPVNYERGFDYGTKNQVLDYRSFEGFKFIYFVFSNEIKGSRYSIFSINYPFLILELLILTAFFIFFYLGVSNEKNENKTKQISQSKIKIFFVINNLFKKLFIFLKEQNRQSLFWATIAILTIAIYILEFFTGVSKLFLSLF